MSVKRIKKKKKIKLTRTFPKKRKLIRNKKNHYNSCLDFFLQTKNSVDFIFLTYYDLQIAELNMTNIERFISLQIYSQKTSYMCSFVYMTKKEPMKICHELNELIKLLQNFKNKIFIILPK